MPGRLAAPFLVLGLAISALSADSAAQEREPPVFVGETLRFSMTILGVAGGELTLSAERSELHGRPAYKLELSAVSNDFLSKLFLVRDYLASWVDPRTLRSLRFEKHTVEGKRVRDEMTEFDYATGVARQDGKEYPLGDATLDSLSSVFYLRTVPLDKPVDLSVFSGEAAHTLRVEVQGRERIQTPAGTFDTIRVEPKSTGQSLIGKGKNLLLWLTDDARKMPVQIKSKLKVGTLIGKLKSIEK
jgi:hypothetical protein